MESGQIRSKQQDIAAYSLFSAFLFIPKRHHNCPLSIRLSFESTLTNWEFVGLFGQWRAVPMRYTSLPPALVRGVVPVRLSGTGGSASPAYPSQKSAKNKNGKHLKIMLFALCFRKFVLPPSLRWRRDTPLTSAGGKASIHPRTLAARQIPFYRFEA